MHLGAREYDSGTGRFLSVDPVVDHQDPQQLNAYAYSSNNPVTLSDPDGRWGFISSFIDATRTVVNTVVRKEVEQVRTFVEVAVPTWRDLVLVYQLVKQEVIKQVIKTTVEIVKKVQHFRKVVRKYVKAAKAIAKNPELRKKLIGGALKRIGDTAKDWGTTAWKYAGPGSLAWTIGKTALTAVALFTCPVCGAVVAVMTVVDLGVAISKGDKVGIAMETAGLLSAGFGSIAAKGVKVATHDLKAAAEGSKLQQYAKIHLDLSNKVERSVKGVDAGFLALGSVQYGTGDDAVRHFRDRDPSGG